MVTELNNEDFSKILKENSIVLVDFWASWCGPCRMVSPIIDGLAEEYDGKIEVGKVNVDEENGIASQFGVSSIPTVVLFKDGTEVKRIVGVRSEDDYCCEIDKLL